MDELTWGVPLLSPGNIAILNTAQKVNIHQVTTMLATSGNVLLPGHNYLLTTGTDDPTLIIARAKAIPSTKRMDHNE